MLNLYDILIEEIDRLIEEGKDPIELINYKFKNVPENIRMAIVNADDTKKKGYARVVLQLYATSNENAVEITNNINNLKNYFDYFRENRLDISSVTSFKELKKMIKTEDEKNNEFSDINCEVLYDSPKWMVIEPLDHIAAKKLGQYTNWCTAGSKEGENYWNKYTDYGDIYINIDKTKTEQRKAGKDANGNEVIKTVPKKYQFLFDYYDPYDDDEVYGMMCDADDYNLARYGKYLPETIEMPQEVVDFYERKLYKSFDEIGKKCDVDYNAAMKSDGISLGKLGYDIEELCLVKDWDGDEKYHLYMHDNYEFKELEANSYDSIEDYKFIENVALIIKSNNRDTYDVYYCDYYNDFKYEYDINKYVILNDDTLYFLETNGDLYFKDYTSDENFYDQMGDSVNNIEPNEDNTKVIIYSSDGNIYETSYDFEDLTPINTNESKKLHINKIIKEELNNFIKHNLLKK